MIELNKVYKDGCGLEWRVVCIDNEGDYPVVAAFRDRADTFTSDGRYNTKYTSHHDLILPEDFRTFAIDEPVMVRDRADAPWEKRHFAFVRNGVPYAWPNDSSSWTKLAHHTGVSWNQCRRPTKEELES